MEAGANKLKIQGKELEEDPEHNIVKVFDRDGIGIWTTPDFAWQICLEPPLAREEAEKVFKIRDALRKMGMLNECD